MNVIDEAMEMIRDRGWWRGDVADFREGAIQPVCVVTAVMRFGNQNDALRLIQEEIPEKYFFLDQWNDDPATSFEDLMLTMKRASVRLDALSG